MSKFLRWLLKPLVTVLLWVYVPGDDWEEVLGHPAFWQFGQGSHHRFSWYFEGKSDVSVSSVEDILTWLRSCRYVGDKELFQEADFWQHPRTFERLREGDCEDFALWAWRKLTELGIRARLYVGKLVEGGRASTQEHAWVVFEDDGQEFLLEPTARTTETAVQPLAAVRDRYRPYYSVDSSYRTKCYSGYVTTMKEDRERRRAFGRADLVPNLSKPSHADSDAGRLSL